MDDLGCSKIAGWQKVIDWFGHWPSFHDAEVVSIELNRASSSHLRVHTFRMTNELDERGHYICDKHAIITFSFKNILTLALDNFNQQNVLSALIVEASDDQIRIVLAGCYGVEGHIEAQTISVDVQPGLAPD